jgi:pimeloyl-ACP methyl ester carboxylesterase
VAAAVRDYAIETTHVNILDWASARGFPLAPEALARIDIPTLVMTGTASHPAPRRANELLGRHIPRARFCLIDGAAHFMIATHAAEVARLIAEHVRGVEAQ